MRFRSTLILFLIAATVLAYFVLVEQPRHERESNRESQTQKLSPIDASEVAHIRVTRGDTIISLQRRGETWVVTEPVSDRAEATTTNILLHTVTAAPIERTLPVSADDLPTYGLGPAATRLLCQTAAGERFSIQIGDFNPDRSACYVNRDDTGNVLMVTAGIKRSVEKPLFDFRDKRVATFEVGSVERFTVSTPAERSWWADADRRWFTLVAKDTIRGDAIAVESILRELRALRAVRITDGSMPYGKIAEPVGTVTVVLPADSVVTFVFGAALDGQCPVAVSGESRIAYVATEVLSIFRRSLRELRFRNVLVFDAIHLSRIALETDGRITSIVRAGQSWGFANPEMGAVSQGEVATLIESLRNLKYREILEERLDDPSRYGLDSPAFRMELIDSAGVIIDVLLATETIPVRQLRYATSRSSLHLGLIDAEPLGDVEHLFESFRTR